MEKTKLLAGTGMGGEVSSKCFSKKNPVHVRLLMKKHRTRSTFHGSLLKKDSKRSRTEISRSGASGSLCNNVSTCVDGVCI